MGDSLVPCLSSPDNSGILTLNVLKLNCILYTVIKIITAKVLTIPELELRALNLQGKFYNLLASIQKSCKDSSVEIMKNIVRAVLQDKSLAHSYELIKQYGNDITRHQSVSGVFEFLINNNFIGYLNYQLLGRFAIEEICGAETDKASQKIAEYKNLHDDFVMIPQFSKLIEVFEEHPHLNPSAVIGLPMLTIILQKSWKDKSNRDLSEWIPFVKENKLLIQSIGCSCIFITFAIFPIDVPDVVKFLDDAEKVEVLRKNGITMEVSTSFNEMAAMLSPSHSSCSVDRAKKLEHMLQKLEEKLQELQNVERALLRLDAKWQKKMKEVTEEVKHRNESLMLKHQLDQISDSKKKYFSIASLSSRISKFTLKLDELVSQFLSYDTKKQPVSSKVKELPLKESCLRPRSICTFSEESHETFADLPEAALRKFSLPNPVTSKCCVDLDFIWEVKDFATALSDETTT